MISCRPAICAGRRRSSATARCPSARTASTTRQNASSHKLRRRGILPKGMSTLTHEKLGRVLRYSRAKYIEGLENRLGRMESLLKLSGLVNEDDLGKTDLGTLEKRLADKSMSHVGHSSKDSNRSSSVNPSNTTPEATQGTPDHDKQSSPRTSVTSPESQKEHEDEVEHLSDMMCSLVTNNCGETRYIGRTSEEDQ
jgi:hypothetical protein